MNFARWRPAFPPLLVGPCILAILFAAFGVMRMFAQVAPPPSPVLPNVRELAGPPPFRPMKLRAITGEPYTLIAKTTVEKKFTDGTWHTTILKERRMRDTEGRERSELLDASGRPITISVTDPVAQTIVDLQPSSKTARVTHVPLPSPEQEARSEDRKAKAAEYRRLHPPSPDDESPLPPQTIAGVYAEGKHHVNVLGALGVKVGDGQEVRVVEETWTAPDLKIPLMSTSDDPRGEKITRTVTELQRADPDPALFQIPADYTTVERN